MLKNKLQSTPQTYKGLYETCYEQIYANKMDYLEEINTFLERYNLPKLNQKEIENMKRPITSTEFESVI